MKFKTEATRKEFDNELLKSDVRVMVYAIDGYVRHIFGLELEITDVWYPKGAFNSETVVHEDWRGIDAVIREATEAQIKKLKKWIRRTFVLAAKAMVPCVYHDSGTGLHLHCQTSVLPGITIVRTTK